MGWGGGGGREGGAGAGGGKEGRGRGGGGEGRKGGRRRGVKGRVGSGLAWWWLAWGGERGLRHLLVPEWNRGGVHGCWLRAVDCSSWAGSVGALPAPAPPALTHRFPTTSPVSVCAAVQAASSWASPGGASPTCGQYPPRSASRCQGWMEPPPPLDLDPPPPHPDLDSAARRMPPGAGRAAAPRSHPHTQRWVGWVEGGVGARSAMNQGARVRVCLCGACTRCTSMPVTPFHPVIHGRS